MVVLIAIIFVRETNLLAYDNASWSSNEMSDFHRNISINLKGGQNNGITWSYSIDRGNNAGIMYDGKLPSGSYLSREWLLWPNATSYFYDNEWPREGTFHEHIDCVGVTPYVMINEPTRDGYSFSGWDTNLIQDGVEVIKKGNRWYFDAGCWSAGCGDIYINARWTSNSESQTVYVRYQNSDGTWGDYQSVIDQEYTIGSTVSWGRDADDCYYGAEISFTADQSSIRYVDIKRKQYLFTLSGIYNGTEMSTFGEYATADVYINGKLAADDCTSYSEMVYFGTSYQIKDIKEKTGCTYDGITGTYDTESGIVTTGGKLYLKFHRNSYKVHFECVGGINGPPDVILDYGEEYPLTSVPTRTGYVITGWNTEIDGSGTGFLFDAVLKNLTLSDGDTITLYAQWNQRRFHIVKIANSWHGGTFVRRAAGDYEWYNSVGRIKINEEIPEEYVLQRWVIVPNGTIERVK